MQDKIKQELELPVSCCLFLHTQKASRQSCPSYNIKNALQSLPITLFKCLPVKITFLQVGIEVFYWTHISF